VNTATDVCCCSSPCTPEVSTVAATRRSDCRYSQFTIWGAWVCLPGPTLQHYTYITEPLYYTWAVLLLSHWLLVSWVYACFTLHPLHFSMCLIIREPG
jgi:hypothetical protein